MASRPPEGLPVPLSVLLFATRERVRRIARSVFPRRRVHLLAARTAAECRASFLTHLVDAVLVDLGGHTDEAWRVAALAREFPSAPFFGLLPLRAADGPALARCATLEFADVLVDGVDDSVARSLVLPRAYTARFAAALDAPPAALGLASAVQGAVWRAIVAHGGRAVRTSSLAAAAGMTREHLSRTFGSAPAPNLKRAIDLVRLIAAAELAKNPGYDIRDVAAVLGFASSSHLASVSQRVGGTAPTSLARLRTVDLVERFAHGRQRSRGATEHRQ